MFKHYFTYRPIHAAPTNDFSKGINVIIIYHIHKSITLLHSLSRYIIVVLTGGDQLRQNNMSKEDFIKDAPIYMRGIFKKYPVVVMNNWAENAREKQRQVEELLREVMTRNEKHMSNELYKKIEERLLKAEDETQSVRVIHNR